MKEYLWMFDGKILPYVVCGALGVWLGEHAFDASIGPWFMYEFGLGALYDYGDVLNVLVDIVCVILVTNIYQGMTRPSEK